MHVQAAELRTAMQDGEHLAGVQQSVRIERALQSLLMREISLRELFGHEVALLDADSVLARQHAADLHAESQDRSAERFRPLELSGVVRFEQDQRMQVSVTGVKHVRHTQAERSEEHT